VTLKSGLEVTGTIESLSTVSYSPSIVTMALYCTISAIKRDIGQKLRFFIPLAFDAPVTRWVSVGILLYRLMYKNWNGEKRLRICLTVSTLYSIVCNVFDW